MKVLPGKELKSIFCSSGAVLFSFMFLLATGLLLWFFPGSYNLLDSGRVSLQPFFSIVAVLFAILIPAVTMRQFAEEKRDGTFALLLSRPVTLLQIYISKFIAVFLFVSAVLLTTIIYVYSLYNLANPVGNIDVSSIVASYLSMFLLLIVFISIGLFASSVTKNQLVAFILAIFISLTVLYVFDLLSLIATTGKTQYTIASLGVSAHYQSMQRGVIDITDLVALLNYTFIFFFLTLFVLGGLKKSKLILCVVIGLLLNVGVFFAPGTRFDFTEDKRYTPNDYTKSLLNGLDDEDIHIEVFLTEDLNAEFHQLYNATHTLLTDFNSLAHGAINVKYQNPYTKYPSVEQMYKNMEADGMPGIVLNEVDREGKTSQKVIYPYAQVGNDKGTLIVPLLKRVEGYTASENINASIESLEFEFADAIRLLNQGKPKNIAFIEGHGELERSYVFDAEELLAKYYFVNRGEIGLDTESLKGMDALVIAGSTSKFADTEKYIIDQYIMSGGKVLWLLDGAIYSREDLAQLGYSASMKNDVNLDDLLFMYGIRINPDFVQDKQCASIYVMSGDDTQNSVVSPCLYMPLLIPSPDHPITKNINDVKATFASSIDFVNNTVDMQKKVLLTSSTHSRLIVVPETVELSAQAENPNGFENSFVPIAVSLEGVFKSAFRNRMAPDSISQNGEKRLDISPKTRMVVVANSDIIRNDVAGRGAQSHIIPMGYDRVSKQQFGNRNFIVNTLNWLTDDDGWMELRNKEQKLRILNKKKVSDERTRYAIINTFIPIVIMLTLLGIIFLIRKRIYEG